MTVSIFVMKLFIFPTDFSFRRGMTDDNCLSSFFIFIYRISTQKFKKVNIADFFK